MFLGGIASVFAAPAPAMPPRLSPAPVGRRYPETAYGTALTRSPFLVALAPLFVIAQAIVLVGALVYAILEAALPQPLPTWIRP